jgi:hypothetical protein
MFKFSFYKRVVSTALVISIISSLLAFGSTSAAAFDSSYISTEGMALGYSIVNGYTKMYLKNNPNDFENKVAVYSGLDVTKPYTLAISGWYFFTNGIDFDKILTDNDYTISKISSFDSYLSSQNIKNERAAQFVNSIKNDNPTYQLKLDTLGMYIIDADLSYTYELMNDNEYVDFVLVNGKVPSNMNDLNFDGVTDKADALLIQRYLADSLELADDDEAAYALFASDYNKDKSINIEDVTSLMRDISS